MPYPTGSSNLTGATRYRSGFRGVLVLQVEVRVITWWKGPLSPLADRKPTYKHWWRDATVEDLRALEHVARQCEA
ncbi:hypothetical protein [Aquamicrobium zhengzhouense]|uniref:Uncharacterized protein n=1 Tax=Aquamicrobium zhengzhouense TaxID=2781738 RepID=A0ABS0SFV2_9HYPH|nr:hypothetical protein [Aquamicrobium zhengzhouense]MBI1621490.1 hypothetical protein [Aquamicrobium zhengzhouense]